NFDVSEEASGVASLGLCEDPIRARNDLVSKRGDDAVEVGELLVARDQTGMRRDRRLVLVHTGASQLLASSRDVSLIPIEDREGDVDPGDDPCGITQLVVSCADCPLEVRDSK